MATETICFAHALDDISSEFNTACKAALLKLTKFDCVSERNDSQMLLRGIRVSKM